MITGKKTSDLLDIEYHNRYHSEKEKSGISSCVDTFEVLNSTTVMVAHDDFIIRVFDIQKGTTTPYTDLYHYNDAQ